VEVERSRPCRSGVAAERMTDVIHQSEDSALLLEMMGMAGIGKTGEAEITIEATTEATAGVATEATTKEVVVGDVASGEVTEAVTAARTETETEAMTEATTEVDEAAIEVMIEERIEAAIGTTEALLGASQAPASGRTRRITLREPWQRVSWRAARSSP